MHKGLPPVLNADTKALHRAGRIDDVSLLSKVYLNKVGLRNETVVLVLKCHL